MMICKDNQDVEAVTGVRIFFLEIIKLVSEFFLSVLFT